MMRFAAVLICSFFVAGALWGAPQASVQGHFDHSIWDKVLKANVTVTGPISRVDYKAIKASPADLSKYLDSLSALSKTGFDQLVENEKLAFLINAYNAFTVKFIIDNYPVTTIRKIGGGWFSNPWKKKFFKLFGEERSLDDVEHEMLRKQFTEPRIHFALVCASKGCPMLHNEAWAPSRLEEQFEDSASKFLQDPIRNRFDLGKQKLYLSNIFKWYREDFLKKYKDVRQFVAPRMSADPPIQNLIKNPTTDIDYTDYDWSINEKGS